MRPGLLHFARLALCGALLAAWPASFARAQADPGAGAVDSATMAAPALPESTGQVPASGDSLGAPAESLASLGATTGADSAGAERDYVAEIRAAFNPESRAYSARRTWLTVIEPLYGILVGLVILFSRLASRLRDIAEGMGNKRYVHVLVYLVLYSLVAWLMTFPLSWYEGFALEHQFALSTQSFGGWLADDLKGQAVLIVFAGVVPLLSLAYRAMERSPRRWWLWFALATLPLVLFFTLIEPVAIDPIFNRFTPLPDAELKSEIVDLARRAGIPGRNVYEVDASTRTTKFNAYVNGFGASQRIVIWDTMLKGMSRDEILYVMGHEMGHYVLGHIWKGVIAVALASFVLFWLSAQLLAFALARWGTRWGIRALHDVASMPLLALTLTVVTVCVQPIFNAYSRRTEHEADLFGLEVTHLNDAGARAFMKLGSQNRSNPEPPAWLRIWAYTHPPLLERVKSALEYHPWTQGQPNRFFHPGPEPPAPPPAP